MREFYMGYDIGSSSIKVSLVDSKSGENLITIKEPENEFEISSPQTDWAEQDPNTWWDSVCKVTKNIIEKARIDASKIKGIGISYQMHGLVVTDKNLNPLRPSIIWCDSRAVAIGQKAFDDLGHGKCMNHLLSSPANFTASKLKWVLDNEPDIYKNIYKYMLPGDFIAAKFTAKICTTKNGLSEGILWDYKEDKVANWLLDYYGIDRNLTPEIVDNFSIQGKVTEKASLASGIPIGCPVYYRAGDQPNNALSLNIFNSGEVAATGGTSGVIYAVTDQLQSKESIRINHFAHVNYSAQTPHMGKLLCINGAGIAFRWLKDNLNLSSYEEMNEKASKIKVGSEALVVIPFGNGAERMLENKNTQFHIKNLDLNRHTNAHLCRATLEGIAFAFVYGMEVLTRDNAKIKVIRAGNDNLFRSKIFASTISTLIGYDIEVYNTTGAIGAARACALKNNDFRKFGDQFLKNDHVTTYNPVENLKHYSEAYKRWKKELNHLLID